MGFGRPVRRCGGRRDPNRWLMEQRRRFCGVRRRNHRKCRLGRDAGYLDRSEPDVDPKSLADSGHSSVWPARLGTVQFRPSHGRRVRKNQADNWSAHRRAHDRNPVGALLAHHDPPRVSRGRSVCEKGQCVRNRFDRRDRRRRGCIRRIRSAWPRARCDGRRGRQAARVGSETLMGAFDWLWGSPHDQGLYGSGNEGYDALIRDNQTADTERANAYRAKGELGSYGKAPWDLHDTTYEDPSQSRMERLAERHRNFYYGGTQDAAGEAADRAYGVGQRYGQQFSGMGGDFLRTGNNVGYRQAPTVNT